jgi:methionyl-tRNA formyltransferase
VQLHSPAPLDMEVAFLSNTPGTAMYHKSSRSLVIRCADDSVLSVPLMKQEGKTLMEAKDWWNGVKGLGLVHDGELKFVNELRHCE